jgi:hypothetical protein
MTNTITVAFRPLTASKQSQGEYAMRYLFLVLALLAFGSLNAGATDFDHELHLQEYVDDGECKTCHQPDDLTITPDLENCKECHEGTFTDNITFLMPKTHGPTWSLKHRLEARIDQDMCLNCHDESGKGPIGCAECHTAGFVTGQGAQGDSMSNIHRGEFKVSHPIAARTDPQLCNTCHETSFCTDCHEGFSNQTLAIDSHRKSWSQSNNFGPTHGNFALSSCQTCHSASVLPTHTWTKKHSREARRNLSTCQSCHPQGDICTTCHSAKTGLGVSPHPKGWSKISNNLKKASGNRTCIQCH